MTAITNRFKARQPQRATERPRPIPTDYAPYHTLPEFDQGIGDYMSGRFCNPYTDPRDGVKAQAHDRGSEYASRIVRCTHQQYLPDFAK
jgi:hypothetical protein